MSASKNIVLVDSREPWPNHPWKRYMPVGWFFERGYLETGDLALATFPESAIVERKTSRDLATCIGAGRERFEKELERGLNVRRLVVVVEGSLTDVVVAARRLHHNMIIETIAAWTLRYAPFVFCGSERIAADFSFRFLAAQLPPSGRRSARTSFHKMHSPDPPQKGEGGPEKTAPRVNTRYSAQLLAQLIDCSNEIRLAVTALSQSELEEWLQTEHGSSRYRGCRSESILSES
jgi:DNA excision repair protein ERCC-4